MQLLTLVVLVIQVALNLGAITMKWMMAICEVRKAPGEQFGVWTFALPREIYQLGI